MELQWNERIVIVEQAPIGSGSDNIGAQIVTNTILEVSHYNYSIMGPKTLF